MRKTLFIKNAAILTVTGLILRFLGIIFKIWLAGRIGAEGIGLYHLVFSVYTLLATFASSGITVAVTRLCVNEITLGSKDGLLRIIRRSNAIVLLISFFSLLITLFGSEFIALRIIEDVRSEESLAILGFSLPFMAVSAVLKGYFTARRKIGTNSAAVLLEQVVRIVLCLYFVGIFSKKGIGMSVAGVILGDTVAEMSSCIFSFICYLFDVKKVKCGGVSPLFYSTKEILRISSPITLGRYITSLLRTAENILMPKALHKAGGLYSRSLSLFGSLKGMALPVLFFPSTVLNAFSTLLIPEMSEALIKKQPKIIRKDVERSMKLTLIIGIIFGGIFFFGGTRIGNLIYSDADSGYLIRVLAPLTPLMYCDFISDGILKGLDQQNFTFKVSVGDSILRIILIAVFVPKTSITGFIYIMYLSNILTFCLNFFKLIKVTGAKIRIISEILFPLTLSVGVCSLSFSLLNKISTDLIFVGAYVLITVILFFSTLYYSGIISNTLK
ncbi:MAG: hypothetical protein E7565_04415 [Ruminococcaceae bacterium]|nr:hypothetical protein [Oscillospiraceae bacterium]